MSVVVNYYMDWVKISTHVNAINTIWIFSNLGPRCCSFPKGHPSVWCNWCKICELQCRLFLALIFQSWPTALPSCKLLNHELYSKLPALGVTEGHAWCHWSKRRFIWIRLLNMSIKSRCGYADMRAVIIHVIGQRITGSTHSQITLGPLVTWRLKFNPTRQASRL